MSRTKYFAFAPLLILFYILISVGCSEKKEPMMQEPVQPAFLPESDKENSGDWNLNLEISDEFEQASLDEDKWLIQGKNNEYKSNFIGRAPAQFSTDNVRLENGKLKLETRWDPDFPFSDKVDEYANGDTYKFENMTTAAVISKKFFRFGYMEIKCKAADASVTSSFWTTGQNSELDVFEFMGAPKQEWKKHLEKEYKFTMHDWAPGQGGKSTWSYKHELDWRVADDFHVYGCEWDAENLKFFADGELVKSVTKTELGDDWVLNNPLWVWVDSETFPWHGIPVEEDLPVDFEIEYIRVWQKK